MAAAGEEAAEHVEQFPPPPAFYKLYGEGGGPETLLPPPPPPPLEGEYEQYGELHTVRPAARCASHPSLAAALWWLPARADVPSLLRTWMPCGDADRGRRGGPPAPHQEAVHRGRGGRHWWAAPPCDGFRQRMS